MVPYWYNLEVIGIHLYFKMRSRSRWRWYTDGRRYNTKVVGSWHISAIKDEVKK